MASLSPQPGPACKRLESVDTGRLEKAAAQLLALPATAWRALAADPGLYGAWMLQLGRLLFHTGATGTAFSIYDGLATARVGGVEVPPLERVMMAYAAHGPAAALTAARRTTDPATRDGGQWTPDYALLRAQVALENCRFREFGAWTQTALRSAGVVRKFVQTNYDAPYKTLRTELCSGAGAVSRASLLTADADVVCDRLDRLQWERQVFGARVARETAANPKLGARLVAWRDRLSGRCKREVQRSVEAAGCRLDRYGRDVLQLEVDLAVATNAELQRLLEVTRSLSASGLGPSIGQAVAQITRAPSSERAGLVKLLRGLPLTLAQVTARQRQALRKVAMPVETLPPPTTTPGLTADCPKVARPGTSAAADQTVDASYSLAEFRTSLFDGAPRLLGCLSHLAKSAQPRFRLFVNVVPAYRFIPDWALDHLAAQGMDTDRVEWLRGRRLEAGAERGLCVDQLRAAAPKMTSVAR